MTALRIGERNTVFSKFIEIGRFSQNGFYRFLIVMKAFNHINMCFMRSYQIILNSYNKLLNLVMDSALMESTMSM